MKTKKLGKLKLLSLHADSLNSKSDTKGTKNSAYIINVNTNTFFGSENKDYNKRKKQMCETILLWKMSIGYAP